jgi:hypothetical protein
METSWPVSSFIEPPNQTGWQSPRFAVLLTILAAKNTHSSYLNQNAIFLYKKKNTNRKTNRQELAGIHFFLGAASRQLTNINRLQWRGLGFHLAVFVWFQFSKTFFSHNLKVGGWLDRARSVTGTQHLQRQPTTLQPIVDSGEVKGV